MVVNGHDDDDDDDDDDKEWLMMYYFVEPKDEGSSEVRPKSRQLFSSPRGLKSQQTSVFTPKKTKNT